MKRSSQRIKHQRSKAVNSAFIYKPCDDTLPEIRVLKLQPASDLEAPIEGYLVHRPLYNETDDFETLSYVWGAPEFVRKITLNGEEFLVTRNLEMALRYLRHPDTERTLWVDALCINQNDADERSRQVRLMKDIYASCKADLAWMLSYQHPINSSTSHSKLRGHHLRSFRRSRLSREEEQDKKVHEDMQLIGRSIEKTKQCVDDMKDVDGQVKSSPLESGPGEEEPEESTLSQEHTVMLAPFFNGSYLWYRVWTMQELSFAPRVVMVAGPHQLDWDIISDFLGDRPFADAFHALFRHHMRGMDWDRTLGGAQRVDHQRRILRKGEYNANLMDVLARFQSNEATDPRDCVYGLLGLVTEDHGITIDYKKSTAEVFLDAAISIINSSHNLDIISQTAWMAGDTTQRSKTYPGISNLPSWVPDFSRQVRYTDHAKILFAQRSIYNSGWDTYAHHLGDSTSDHRLLSAEAVILGVIVRKVTYPRNRFAFGREANRAPGQWLKESSIGAAILDTNRKYAPTGETELRAYWRTLMLDCACYPIRRLTNEEIEAGDIAFERILDTNYLDNVDGSGKSHSGVNIKSIAKVRRRRDSRLLHRLWEDDIPEPMRSMWRRTYEYWSFTTTNHGLFAMVQHAMPGDIIASVNGAKVPLILRATKHKHNRRRMYRLVGTAYVHGYMDGEALLGVARGSMSKESILIL